MIQRDYLMRMYVDKQFSVNQIADSLACSPNKVTYWLQKYGLRRRSISEALYAKHNPEGDPFTLYQPKSNADWLLYGLGLGLFWGEGNKANRYSVRLGNTDIALVMTFLDFLVRFYNVDKSKLRFGLQIFHDISTQAALRYWVQGLGVPQHQFQKVVVTKSVRKGTYKHKSKYGVLTLYFSNVKLRDIIVNAITKLQEGKPS